MTYVFRTKAALVAQYRANADAHHADARAIDAIVDAARVSGSGAPIRVIWRGERLSIARAEALRRQANILGSTWLYAADMAEGLQSIE